MAHRLARAGTCRTPRSSSTRTKATCSSSTGRPSHRRDFNRRVVDWVERYAGGSGSRPSPASGRGALAAALGGSWRSGTASRVPSSASSASATAATRSATAAYGVVNKETGVATTEDSVFQIGSMTKVWTATIAMQLVDEGQLDLDAPDHRRAARR